MRMLAPNPNSLTALIAWLKTKAADEAYCYMDRGKCLAAQYKASIGEIYDTRTVSVFRYDRDPSTASFDDMLEYIGMQPVNVQEALRCGPKARLTFQGALELARKIANNGPIEG
jgi:hypothetical protein